MIDDVGVGKSALILLEEPKPLLSSVTLIEHELLFYLNKWPPSSDILCGSFMERSYI